MLKKNCPAGNFLQNLQSYVCGFEKYLPLIGGTQINKFPGRGRCFSCNAEETVQHCHTKAVSSAPPLLCC